MASTTQTTSTSLPDWVQPYAQSYLDRASQVADQPYQQYTGQQVAGLNGTQMTAMDAIQNRAMAGNPYMNTAQQSLQGIAAGNSLGAQAAQNPYLTTQNAQAGASNPYLNVMNAQAYTRNPYADSYNQQASASNPYLNAQNPLAQGENPYLQQQIDAASADALRNYNTAIRPQMDAAMAQSGSFGNSGLQQVQAQQQTDLGRQLGNISAGMRMQDYTTRQGLQENAVNRQFQGGQQLQQNQFSAGQQLAQNLYNSGAQQQQNLYNAGQQQANNLFQGGQQQAQNLYNAGAQYQNQLFQGGQAQANAQNQLFQNQQANQMQALSMAPQFAAQDYTDANALMNVGNTLQQQQQNVNNADYQNWLNAQNWNRNQTQFLGSAMGFNFGQNSNSTQTQNQASGSKLGSAVGGALAGYGSTGSGWGALAGGIAGLLGN